MSTSQARSPSRQALTSDSVTSPTRKTAPRETPKQQTSATRTGFPPNIEGPYQSFTQVPIEDAPRGNRRYDFMMRSMGYYGHFLPIDRKAKGVTPITLDAGEIRTTILHVLKTVLTRALHMKGHILQQDIKTLAAETAQTLTNGCMMMLYCRLRAVNRSYIETYKIFMQKPHVPDQFEIPTPYALAFQYLGLFRVENLTHELELIPVVSADEAKKQCLGTAKWSPTAYQTALEFAKSLGLSFSGINQTVKLGSAWWLLKSNDEEDYNLQCCLPESNYTLEDATIRALWCITETGSFHVDIADLSSLDMNRGTYLRNPPPDLAITTFYGMMEAPEQIWDIS